MFEYICKDLAAAMCYLPYGLGTGIPIGIIVVWMMNHRRKRKGEKPLNWLSMTLFCVYLAVILAITFLSRESGSRKGMDLELFSTWGINERNNAYVIENILLFIPYGFLCSLNFQSARNFFICTLVGAMTSLGIETLQLITERGFFQVDDILTNTLGAMVGCLLFLIGNAVVKLVGRAVDRLA